MNKTLVQHACIPCLLAILSGCAALNSELRKQALTVPPGQLTKYRGLVVRSPNNKGWQIVPAKGTKIVYGKSGQASDESFIATVSTAYLPSWNSTKDFVAEIRELYMAEGTEGGRFKYLRHRFSLYSARSYPCVHEQAAKQDRKAQVSGSKTESLLLELNGWFCQRPGFSKGHIFAVTYSHRGKHKYPALDREAKAFFAGVTVAGNDK